MFSGGQGGQSIDSEEREGRYSTIVLVNESSALNGLTCFTKSSHVRDWPECKWVDLLRNGRGCQNTWPDYSFVKIDYHSTA